MWDFLTFRDARVVSMGGVDWKGSIEVSDSYAIHN